MAGTIPTAALNSGHKIPVIGLGTGWLEKLDDLSSVLLSAIEVGYRHFDTAAMYGTEEALGHAIAVALKQGVISSRDELFITSKLWCTDAHPELVLPALQKSLEKLGLDYLDLYLIHWPLSMKHGEIKFPLSKEELLPIDMKATWEAMENCHRLGLAKSIGVSNFSSKKLAQLLNHASIPPSVNQVEMNVAWNQKKLKDFCNEKAIHITAWSPLASNGAPWGSTAVMHSPVLKEIALAKGKSVAQVALRWLYEQGVSMVAKSFNKERMMQNLQIFDWKLSEEELEKIQNIPQFRGFPGDMFVSDTGPYKSIEELWDGEI